MSLLLSIAPRRLVNECTSRRPRSGAANAPCASASMLFDESIACTESRIALPAMAEDASEGLKAFGEKRRPS
jgi:hypothetical protein